jgi:hypothetical protein
MGLALIGALRSRLLCDCDYTVLLIRGALDADTDLSSFAVT